MRLCFDRLLFLTLDWCDVGLCSVHIATNAWRSPRNQKCPKIPSQKLRNVTDIVTPHTSVFQMSHPAYYALIHIPPDPKTAYLSSIQRKITFLRIYWRRKKGKIQFVEARATKRYVRAEGRGRLQYCELLVPLNPPPDQ